MSYSERLLQQGNSLTRLAHKSRFSVVLDAISNQQYSQAIDYGCGDGWLLRSAYDLGIVTSGIGVDVESYMLSDCQKIFADLPEFQFCQPHEISEKILPKSCDLFLCTETLEHVENPETVLDQILPYCQIGARMVISVPIEIGSSLIIKQIGRYFANLKGGYGYEKYSLGELFSASILWDTHSFPSSHSLNHPYKGHKGFDYRKLEKIIQKKVTIERRIFSPLPWIGNLLNSTVIWICSVSKNE